MLQLYFMSIVLNGIIGFLFIFGDTGENDTIEKSVKFSFTSGGFRLILGILTTLTGLLKLFLPMKGETAFAGIPILGDLIPALAGIAGGFILLFGFYRENSTRFDKDNDLDRIGDSFLRYKKVLGFVLAAVAVLHFLFPKALFL